MARLEGLGQVLKDRQSTVLATLKHEREVGRFRRRGRAGNESTARGGYRGASAGDEREGLAVCMF